MKYLNDYDMVLALSQGQINLQFWRMWDNGDIPRQWAEKLEGGGAFEATIAPPCIGILKDDVKHLELTIEFSKGKFTYHPKGESGGQEFDMAGWRYVFRVAIGQLEYVTKKQDPKAFEQQVPNAGGTITKIIADSRLPADHFTVDALFLDINRAQIAQYNVTKSHLPGLEPPMLERFQALLARHFESLGQGRSPYILAYAVKRPDVKTTDAVLAPTRCHYSTSFKADPNQAGESDAAQSSLNYMMMTAGRPAPEPAVQDQASIQRLFIQKGNAHSDGAFYVDYPLFRETVLAHLPDMISGFIIEYWNEYDESKLNRDGDTGKSMFTIFNTNITNIKSRIESAPGHMALEQQGYAWNTVNPWKAVIEMLLTGENILDNFKYVFREDDSISPGITIGGDEKGLAVIVSMAVEMNQHLERYRDVSWNPVGWVVNPLQTVADGVGEVTGLSSWPKTGFISNNTQPTRIRIVLRPDIQGTMSAEISESTEGQFTGDLIPVGGVDEQLEFALNNLRTILKTIGPRLKDALAETLKNGLRTYVVLPFGEVNTFKNIRFNREPGNTLAADNAVVCDITYAPRTNGQ